MSNNLRQTPQRNRKVPKRLGVADNNEFFEEEGDQEEVSAFADDSIEDAHYVPGTEEEASTDAEESFYDHDHDHRDEKATTNPVSYNFDNLYDDILESNQVDQQKSRCEPVITDVNPIVSSNASQEPIDLQQLLTISKEILGRVKRLEHRVLEKEIIDTASNATLRMSQSEMFLTHLGLPYSDVNSVIKFNDLIKNEEFKKGLFDALLKMDDRKNIFTTGSTEDILKLFISKIIDKNTLSYFTWTGKTKQKKYGKKNSFEVLENLNLMLYQLVFAKDQRYTAEMFNFHMVKCVFKYAYTKRSEKIGAKEQSETNPSKISAEDESLGPVEMVQRQLHDNCSLPIPTEKLKQPIDSIARNHSKTSGSKKPAENIPSNIATEDESSTNFMSNEQNNNILSGQSMDPLRQLGLVQQRLPDKRSLLRGNLAQKKKQPNVPIGIRMASAAKRQKIISNIGSNNNRKSAENEALLTQQGSNPDTNSHGLYRTLENSARATLLGRHHGVPDLINANDFTVQPTSMSQHGHNSNNNNFSRLELENSRGKRMLNMAQMQSRHTYECVTGNVRIENLKREIYESMPHGSAIRQ